MGTAADYRKKLGPREVVLDGDTWVYRTMRKVEHAKFFGGFTLVVGSKKGEGMTQERMDKWEETERLVFDAQVDGIKNPETGEPEKVPYDEVGKAVFDELWPLVMGEFSAHSSKADEVRGAL